MKGVKEMKKIIGTILICCFVNGIILAQNTPKERTEKVMSKFESVFKLSKDQNSAVKSTFLGYYEGIEKLREELKPGKAQGDEAYQKARRQKELLMSKREAQLKKILSAQDYQKWVAEISSSIKID